MRKLVIALIISALTVGVASAADDNWPQFRGSRSGVAKGKNLPQRWSATENVAWQMAIPGRGWSSPIVWGNKVFITTVVSSNADKLPRKGLYVQDIFGKIPPGEHEWRVYCLDLQKGSILWHKTAFQGKPVGTIHVKNSYASETPVTDGKRLYAYFGNHGMVCYDLEGKQLWKEKWTSQKTRMGWGTGASPVVYKDHIYIVNDNEENSALVAVKAKTGKEAWRKGRPEKSNWATPFIWENDQRTEIITAGTGKVRSYGLDGKLLWEFGGMSSITIPTPSVRGGLLYISSGYVADFFSRPVYAIRPGASGDITLKKGETSNKHIIWCQKQAAPYHPSPIVYENYVYVLLDQGFLTCLDAKTGKEVYKRQRLPSAGFTASPVAGDGKVYCLSEDGDTFVIKAGADFKILAKNRLDEMALATPALVGDRLIIRTAGKVYCIRNKNGKK